MADAFIALGVGLIAYAWFIYPLLLRIVPPRPETFPSDAPELPEVAVIISAHNEEKHLRARIENIARLHYPADKISIYLGVDGSSDGTSRIAAELAAGDARLHVTDSTDRRGKIAMLKDLVAESVEPILLFTDANSMFEPDALGHLVRHFQDPVVGGICGRLVFLDAEGTPSDEGVYWRWETRLKTRESAIDSCLGANGAIYAIRRELFWTQIPANTIVDDFVIGMKVREQGVRMLYEPQAEVREELPPDASHEWGRRVRIGAGDFQALTFCRRLLTPRYGRFAWMFFSHKVLRWCTSHILIVVAIATIAGLTRPVTAWTVAGFMLCAGLAAGWLFGRVLGERRIPGLDIFRQCAYFMTIQAALLCGFLRFCRGGLAGHWDRTDR